MFYAHANVWNKKAITEYMRTRRYVANDNFKLVKEHFEADVRREFWTRWPEGNLKNEQKTNACEMGFS